MDVNTTSKHPTHFLRAVELIKKGREEFKVPSENWPHPTEYRFGIPNDLYYAEVWSDGMDWQPSYWVIEEKQLEKPQIQPFIIFNSNEARSKFHDYDFEQLIRAALWLRRDVLWIKQDSVSYFSDSVWPYLTIINELTQYKKMTLCEFEHASQERVLFLMNEDFISDIPRNRQ